MKENKPKLAMNLQTFIDSLKKAKPPKEASQLLVALWHEAKGDWDRAHDMVNDIGHPDADWIHAYLHRKEGDQWNAGYWYRRAGKNMPDVSLEMEWKSISEELLARQIGRDS